MANVLQTAVTITDSYLTDGNGGKKYTAVVATVVLATQGGTTNRLPASVLGLRTIAQSSSAVASDNTIYLTSPSYDGSFVIFNGGDISKTVKLIVKGNH